MRIYVKVIPCASNDEVIKISEEEYKAKVTAPPEKGRANKAVIKLLADHFGVPKNLVRIAAGRTARVKIIDVGQHFIL